MEEVVEFRATVHIFGATSSPGSATFGLRSLAADSCDPENQFDMQAKDFIMNDFYVDDGLLSVDTAEQAVEVVNSVVTMCAKGNVRLHKFVSNDKSVLSAIPESEHAESLSDLDLSSVLPVERALGVQWCIESDQFQFRVTLSNQPVTRRGVLSTIASVFDPLGFLSPYILLGKQILQDMCRENAGWDKPLSDQVMPKWLAWRDGLTGLGSIKVERCLTPQNFGTIVSTELHHFSDASTSGYGQCSYIRIVNTEGRVHCALLAGKSRVAPIKAVTVPRLELQAAVLSAKMAQIVQTELKLTEISRVVFWVDSQVVLGYIRNQARRFNVYVANRVQQIKDLVGSDEWYYVNTANNPADIASRGLSVEKLIESS